VLVDRQERPTDYNNRSPSSRSTEIGKQLQRIFEGREVSEYPVERQEICPIYAWRILGGVRGRRHINMSKIAPQSISTATNCEWLRIAVRMDQLVYFGSVPATFAQASGRKRRVKR
jgi:hypothetical protein